MLNRFSLFKNTSLIRSIQAFNRMSFADKPRFSEKASDKGKEVL